MEFEEMKKSIEQINKNIFRTLNEFSQSENENLVRKFDVNIY